MLDLNREDRFIQLAQDGPILREIDVLHELLCDGAPALIEMQVEEILEPGLAGTEQVEAAMLIEGAVLDRNRRLEHRRCDLVQRHDVSPLGPLVDLGQQDGSSPIVDSGGEWKPGRAEIGSRGESRPDVEQTG